LSRTILAAGAALVAASLLTAAPGQETPPQNTTVPSQAVLSEASGGKRGKAHLTDLGVTLDDLRVVASFKLANAFDEELEQSLESGLPTSLDYVFELVRIRRMWFNKTVEKSRLEVVATYDAVAREYLVNYKLDGDLISSRVLTDRSELRAAMTAFDDLELFSLAGQKGDLRFRVRAVLGTGSFLFFIPTVRATDWVERRVEIDEDGNVELARG
jgi:hypothetical protein